MPDAMDEAHWYVKPVASLPGHTPATSGGPGLPHAPLYVCSGFNRKHGTGDDRTTAPPDAYPLPVASAPGGGDPGSADGESKASTGPCACSLGNPSVANVASTTDEGTGATKSPAGHWTDPVSAVNWSVGPISPGGVQVLGEGYGDLDDDQVKTIELVGGASVRFIKVRDKWYRPLGVYDDSQSPSGKATYFPDPDRTCVTTDDGEQIEYDSEEYVVPQEVIDRFETVRRGGIALPANAVQNLDAVANFLGVNEEVGLVLQAYAWGFASKDESFKIAGALVAIGVTAAITMHFTGGGSIIAGKLLAKRVVREFLKWVEKKAAGLCNEQAVKLLRQWIQKATPKEARRVLDFIRKHNGTPPAGYKGGRVFRNLQNKLPKVDSKGAPIDYREYDIFPKVPGQPRSAGRVVVGSDGKAYYSDHYGDPVLDSFTEMQ